MRKNWKKGRKPEETPATGVGQERGVVTDT